MNAYTGYFIFKAILCGIGAAFVANPADADVLLNVALLSAFVAAPLFYLAGRGIR